MQTRSSKLPSHARLAFEGEMFDVYQWDQAMFDGSTAVFESIVRADSADAILVDAEGRIGINRQEQPGRPEFFGTYGGRMEPGEDPLEAAKRELLEESGYAAKTWESLLTHEGSSKILHAVHYYVARDIERVAEPHLDSGEKIVPLWVEFDEFVDLLVGEKLRVDTRLALMFARAKLGGTLDDLRRRILGQ